VFSLAVAATRSGMVVSGVMLSRAIPAMLIGPAAGVALDRLNRKQAMIASDLIRAVVALGFILAIGRGDTWLLYSLSALLMGASPSSPPGAPPFCRHRHSRGAAYRQFAHPNHGVDHAHHRTFLAGVSVMQFGYRWAFVAMRSRF